MPGHLQVQWWPSWCPVSTVLAVQVLSHNFRYLYFKWYTHYTLTVVYGFDLHAIQTARVSPDNNHGLDVLVVECCVLSRNRQIKGKRYRIFHTTQEPLLNTCAVCSRAPSRPAQPTWLFSFQRRRRPAINSSNRIHGDVPPMQIPGAPTPRRNIGWVEQKFKAPKKANDWVRKERSHARYRTHV